MRIPVNAWLLLLLLPWPARGYGVLELQSTGDPGNRIDLVILGDGYRAEDLGKLSTDVDELLGYLWSEPPLGEYRTFFNVKLIQVISNETGADNGSYGDVRDTALGANFGCYGIDRLLCVDDATVFSVAAEHVPEYDLLVVIVNDPKYGGAGGALVTISVDPLATSIVAHEFGHVLADLADEYEDAYPGYPGCGADCPEPNVTTHTERGLVKWNLWVDEDTPLPTPETSAYSSVVGVFEGARYQASGVYRPRRSCMMRSLGSHFGEVCSEALVLSMYGMVRPFDGASPQSPVHLAACESAELSVTYPSPDPDTVEVTWRLNGRILQTGPARYEVWSVALGDGTHQITAEVSDETALVRNAPAGLLRHEHGWTVLVTDAGQGACVIGDRCYPDGSFNPANPCQVCRVSVDPSAWSNDDSRACDDNDVCTQADRCAGGSCTGTFVQGCCREASDCDDGIGCTLDACDPGSHVCSHEVAATLCLIDGACHQNGIANPVNPCQICNSGLDSAAWYDMSDLPCGEGTCVDGVCVTSSGCGSCATGASGALPAFWPSLLVVLAFSRKRTPRFGP